MTVKQMGNREKCLLINHGETEVKKGRSGQNGRHEKGGMRPVLTDETGMSERGDTPFWVNLRNGHSRFPGFSRTMMKNKESACKTGEEQRSAR
ncbi:MAG: hypothetical protein V3S51_05980 [Dehalococcoidia bacterium]